MIRYGKAYITFQDEFNNEVAPEGMVFEKHWLPVSAGGLSYTVGGYKLINKSEIDLNKKSHLADMETTVQ